MCVYKITMENVEFQQHNFLKFLNYFCQVYFSLRVSLQNASSFVISNLMWIGVMISLI